MTKTSLLLLRQASRTWQKQMKTTVRSYLQSGLRKTKSEQRPTIPILQIWTWLNPTWNDDMDLTLTHLKLHVNPSLLLLSPKITSDSSSVYVSLHWMKRRRFRFVFSRRRCFRTLYLSHLPTHTNTQTHKHRYNKGLDLMRRVHVGLHQTLDTIWRVR